MNYFGSKEKQLKFVWIFKIFLRLMLPCNKRQVFLIKDLRLSDFYKFNALHKAKTSCKKETTSL